MTPRFRPSTLLIPLLLLAACKPDHTEPVTATPPAQDASVQATRPPPLPETDAVAAVDNASAGEVTDQAGRVIDAKALAGTFEGNGSQLEIAADGTYRQTLKAAGAELTSDGTWASAAAGVMLLDPNDKAAQDVRFDVVSADELRSQDGTYTFKRAH
ncbi:hypothetical protein [Pseudoxanthomonas sp. JBR18]|uniref:hypothetical protein n=1 Tax=Pseudoxanthomonas sp. JBR18 TaxID=2969308 RepID=UPI002306912C|nr:hypothetical protein [Pseudoxanthomonas sp. JBR18]WCE03319.1 hypothetical protein PJ250_14555 [Pseudoxanthomonas sp. JBR18]